MAGEGDFAATARINVEAGNLGAVISEAEQGLGRISAAAREAQAGGAQSFDAKVVLAAYQKAIEDVIRQASSQLGNTSEASEFASRLRGLLTDTVRAIEEAMSSSLDTLASTASGSGSRSRERARQSAKRSAGQKTGGEDEKIPPPPRPQKPRPPQRVERVYDEHGGYNDAGGRYRNAQGRYASRPTGPPERNGRTQEENGRRNAQTQEEVARRNADRQRGGGSAGGGGGGGGGGAGPAGDDFNEDEARNRNRERTNAGEGKPSSGGDGEGVSSDQKAVNALRQAADLAQRLSQNFEYLDLRLASLASTGELTARVFDQVGLSMDRAVLASADAAQSRENFNNRVTNTRLGGRSDEDIALAGEALRSKQTATAQNRLAAQGLAGPQDTEVDQNLSELQYAQRLRTQQQNALRNAQRLGVQLPEGPLEEAPTERLNFASRQYQTALSRNVPTEGRDLTQVVEALRANTQAVTRAAETTTRTSSLAVTRSGRPPGAVTEFLGASVSGIGGYRSASRLPQGALAGNALGALGRGAAGGLAFNAFFALQGGLQQSISAALQLDKQMAELKDTIDNLGAGGGASSFGQVRDSLLGISQATGVAGSDVLALGQQFLGLTNNANAAVEATKAVAQYIAITGESASTAGPEFATITSNLGITARQAGNAAVTAGRASGRTASDINQGVAAFAPVASEFGLTGSQTYGLVAATARGSSYSGSDVGQSLGRILEQLPGQITAIERESNIRFTNPASGIQDIRDLIQGSATLSGQDKRAVTQTLGGARNANVLAALQQDPNALKLIGGNYTNNNALAQRNAAVQATLAQSFTRLRAAAEDLASKLLQSGIGQIFTSIVSAGTEVAHFLATVGGLLGTFNNALGGVPARLAEFVILLGTLNRVGAISKAGSILTAVGGAGLARGVGTVGLTDPLFVRQQATLRDRFFNGVTATANAVKGQTPEQRAAAGAAAEQTTVEKQNVAATDQLTVAQTRLLESTRLTTAALETEAASETGLASATAKADAALLAQRAEQGATGGIGAGAGALSALGGPAGIVLIGAAVATAIAGALANSHNTALNTQIAKTDNTLSGLTPAQLQTIAAGGTAGGIKGTSKPQGYTEGTLSYIESALSYVLPSAPGPRLTGKPLHEFGTAKPSIETHAGDANREVLYSAATGGPGTFGYANVQAAGSASGVDQALLTQLSAANSAYSTSDTAKNYAALRRAYQQVARTAGGQTAIETAANQANQTNAYSRLSASTGLNFQNTGDITTAFQGGLLNVQQAKQAFGTIISTDNNSTQAAREQTRSDKAALAQFVSDQLTQVLSDQIAAGAAILGQTPGDAFNLTVAALSNKNLTAPAKVQLANQAVQSQAQQLAQQISLIGVQTPGYLAGQSVTQQYQSLLNNGGAPVTAAQAGQIDAALKAQNPNLTPSQLPYQAVARYQQQLAAYQQRQAAAADRAQLLVHARGPDGQQLTTGQLAADTSPGARPVAPQGLQYAKLGPQQRESLIQGYASYLQAQQAQQQAILQASGGTADQLAALKEQGDQQTLQQIRAQIAKAFPGTNVNQNPEVIAAETQLKNDQYAAVQTAVSGIFSIADIVKSQEFNSPLQQAQTDLRAAQAAAARYGTSIAQLQAQLANGTITETGKTILSRYTSSQQEQFQSTQQNISAIGGITQAQQFQTPVAAAQTQIQTAEQQARAAGTSIQQIIAEKNAGTLNNSAFEQILQSYYQGQAALFQGISTAAQSEIALVQSQDLTDPLRSTNDTISLLNQEVSKQFGSLQNLNAQAAAGNEGAKALVAQRNQALYQAFQQQQAGVQGYFSLLAAQATAVGNTPQAADIQLKAAQQALAAFKAKYPQSANLNNSVYSQLVTAVATAEGNALTTRINFDTNLISQQVTDNQISIGQAIQKLRVLQQAARAAGNFSEVESLQTAIQQYINQGNANAAFNLPSNINIPTLYEARRTEGTSGGATYNGNTGTVNVNINIGSNGNTQAAVNALMQAVGGPPTSGNVLPIH